MILNKETIFTKDAANRKIRVSREFDAPRELVWKAWTEKELLDQWWAPKPWQAHTTQMDFREGGTWLYYMEGPDGTRHFARADYGPIEPKRSFEAQDSFCDENGTIMPEPPGMHWVNVFSVSEQGTRVDVEISFDSEASMEKIIEMGFQEGFTAAHGNLDELLESLVKTG